MLPTLFYGRHISERIAELSNRFIFNYTKRYLTVRISMQPVKKKKKKKSPKASCIDQLPPQKRLLPCPLAPGADCNAST